MLLAVFVFDGINLISLVCCAPPSLVCINYYKAKSQHYSV